MSGKISLSSLLGLFTLIERVASKAEEYGRLLRGIIELVQSEAAVNPVFAAKLDALMKPEPKPATKKYEAEKNAAAKQEEAERKAAAKQEEAAKKAAAKKEQADKKAAAKQEEADKKAAAKKAEAEQKAAAKQEEAERKAAAKKVEAEQKAAAKKEQAGQNAAEKTTVPKAAPEKVVGPPDVYEELKARGDDGLRIWLIDQPMEILKAIIKQERFDPSRRTLRWTDQKKFADHIVQALRAKMSRGSAFIGTMPDTGEPSTG
jgi:DNA polymerase III gamma/tau subunit